MKLLVKSLQGLDQKIPFRCVLQIGGVAYDILPKSSRSGTIVVIADGKGKAVELRLMKIEKLPQPIRRV